MISGTWCYDLLHLCLWKATCTRETVKTDGLELFINAYYLAIGMFSIIDRQKNHGPALRHLYVLSSFKVLLMGTVTCLPTQDTTLDGQALFSLAWNIDLACSLAAWIIAVSIPQGPSLHYPPEKIYSSKTLLDSGPFPEENVSDEVGTCNINPCITLNSTYMRI